MATKYLLFNASFDDSKEAVIKALQAKGYKVSQSLENKIIAKHGLSASYYPHDIEVSFITEKNCTAVLGSINHRAGELYLDRFFDELKKHLTSAQLPALTITPSKEDEAIIGNRNLNPGEQIIWSHVVQKGLLKKEEAERWIITNQRAIKHILATKDNPQEKFMALPLDSTETVVMNQFRKSKGDRVGVFAGGYRAGGVAGVSTGTSSSVSMTYGDLVFLYNGKEFFRFQGISDPHGVNRVIKAIKKQRVE